MPFISNVVLKMVPAPAAQLVTVSYTLKGDPHYEGVTNGVLYQDHAELWRKGAGGQYHVIPDSRMFGPRTFFYSHTLINRILEKTFPLTLLLERALPTRETLLVDGEATIAAVVTLAPVWRQSITLTSNAVQIVLPKLTLKL